MKKVLLSILAVAAMASCVQSEDVNPQQLIDFGSPFVGGTTKAIDYSYGANKLLKDIYVYGTVTGTSGNPSLVFNHTHVYSEGTTAGTIYNQDWKYDGVSKYWVPGADYRFVALNGVAQGKVTVNDAGAEAYLPNKITFEGDGKTDLLLSSVSRKDVGASGNETVAFTMQHLLSKVKFTVNNTSTIGEDYYKVTDIQIKNAYTQGNCAIAYAGGVDAGTWAASTTWTTTGTAGVNFGHATAIDTATEGAAAMNLIAGAQAASNYDYLVVPCNYSADNKMQVSFKLALYDKSGVEINSPAEKTADVVIDIKAGYQYNFILNLAFAQAIDFTVIGAPTWSDDTAQSQVVSGTFN